MDLFRYTVDIKKTKSKKLDIHKHFICCHIKWIISRSPTPMYMQNYLELMDKLLISEIPTEIKSKAKERDDIEKEEKLLCGSEGIYNFLLLFTR